MKAKIKLILVCAAISVAPCIVSAQTPATSPIETAATAPQPPREHRSHYGLFGLLGLLGLVGLKGRKSGPRKGNAIEERAPAPPGSYVSDLKAAPRPRPE